MMSLALDMRPVAVVDVQYGPTSAVAACVVAASWSDGTACEERIARVSPIADYEPGAFFKRELPCIVQVLSLVRGGYAAVVVDGYVELDAAGHAGLGAHLHQHLRGEIVVVGAAKTRYPGAPAEEVCRGASKRPLYVSARGLSNAEAGRLVAGMHGPHRIPTLFARADQLAREIAAPITS
jgi:deoxyribonuclease V